MEHHNASERFEAAKRLFAQGHYAQALAEIDALLARYPGNVQLMASRVRCLGAMNRMEEAFQLCRELEALHGYAGSGKLVEWLKKLETDGKKKKGKKDGVPVFQEPAVAPKGLWGRLTAWATRQSGTRLVFLLMIALLALVGVPALTSSGTWPETGARILAYAVMLLLLSFPGIHDIMPILIRAYYTSGFLLGSLYAVVSLPFASEQPIPAFIGLLLVRAIVASLLVMAALIVGSLAFALASLLADMAQRSCLFRIVVVFFLPYVLGGLIGGLLLLPVLVIGLKLSAMMTGMDDEDISLSMNDFSNAIGELFGGGS